MQKQQEQDYLDSILTEQDFISDNFELDYLEYEYEDDFCILWAEAIEE